MTSKPKRSVLKFREDLLYRLRWNVFGPLDEIEIRTGPWNSTTNVPLFGHHLAHESIASPPFSRIDEVCIAECLDRRDLRYDVGPRYTPPPASNIHNEDGSPITLGQFVTEVHAYLNLHAEALKDTKAQLYGRVSETNPRTRTVTCGDPYLPPKIHFFFKRAWGVQIGEVVRFSIDVFAEGEHWITAEDFWARQLRQVRFRDHPEDIPPSNPILARAEVVRDANGLLVTQMIPYIFDQEENSAQDHKAVFARHL